MYFALWSEPRQHPVVVCSFYHAHNRTYLYVRLQFNVKSLSPSLPPRPPTAPGRSEFNPNPPQRHCVQPQTAGDLLDGVPCSPTQCSLNQRQPDDPVSCMRRVSGSHLFVHTQFQQVDPLYSMIQALENIECLLLFSIVSRSHSTCFWRDSLHFEAVLYCTRHLSVMVVLPANDTGYILALRSTGAK